MSRFLKISMALIGSLIVSATAFAQSTIEEVIVTAQRTEQSLQSVPIAVSAFTAEALEERQIEVSSDLQLQVPGITFSSDTFSGGGGFSIRGIANFATAASADAGVEIHMNGLPLGTTSANEVGFLDMARIEVLRGPQGTLFGRNSTGGVINLITARPDLDAFSGSAKINYGKDNEKNLKLLADAWRMAQEIELAIPIMEKAARLAKDGQTFIILGSLYLSEDKLEEAVDAIEQGLKKGKVKNPSQARLTLGQAHFELQNFEQAKKEFRIAARDDDKKIKKTANSWIKYTENEEIRVKNIALRRDYIQNQG